MANIIKKMFMLNADLNVNNRNNKIDFIRGFAMILVLLHHCFIPFGGAILLFHMPLFFILSGYTDVLCSKKNDSFKNYFKKRFKRLIIPYLEFEFINLAIWYIYCLVTNKTISITKAIYSILICVNIEDYTGLCGRLWFLPCMFISNIYSWIIINKVKSNKGKIIFIFIFIILSFVSSNIIINRLPFTLDTALLATSFLLIGCIGNKIINYIITKREIIKDIMIFIISIIIFYISYYYGNAQMLMYINKYGNYGPTIICALSGTIMFLILCKYIYAFIENKNNIIKKIILWYSYNSLATFPVHLQIKCILLLINYTIFSKFIILFPIVLVLNIIVVNLINYYFPFLIMKKIV